LRPPRWETNRSNTLNPRVHCEGDFVYVETTEDATDSTAPPVDTAEGATPEALCEVQQAAGGLPADVLCNVLKRLHTFQLPNAVCCGWAAACNDKALWRTYCKAAWGEHCQPQRYNNDWQVMYRERPRPLFHGIYCVKVSYSRAGEASTHYENVWHAVNYYRYFSFVSTGQCWVSRTFVEPAQALANFSHVMTSEGPPEGLAEVISSSSLEAHMGQWRQSKDRLEIRSRPEGAPNQFCFQFVRQNGHGEPLRPNQGLLLDAHVLTSKKGEGPDLKLKAGFTATFLPFPKKLLRSVSCPTCD